ncbi:hypothetical protein Plhal304r1_c020g0071971 [Plasmopara halstedii]
MPLLHNAIIRHGSQDRTLATRPSALIYTVSLVIHLRRRRLLQRFNVQVIQERITYFLVDCDIALRVLRHLPHGPRPSQVFASAFHDWIIGEHHLEDLTVAKTRSMLKSLKPPALPYQRLVISKAPGPDF